MRRQPPSTGTSVFSRHALLALSGACRNNFRNITRPDGLIITFEARLSVTLQKNQPARVLSHLIHFRSSPSSTHRTVPRRKRLLPCARNRQISHRWTSERREGPPRRRTTRVPTVTALDRSEACTAPRIQGVRSTCVTHADAAAHLPPLITSRPGRGRPSSLWSGSACSLVLPRLSCRPPPSPAVPDLSGSAHRDGQCQGDLKCAPDRSPSGLLKSVQPTGNHERDEKKQGRQFVLHHAFLALPGVCRIFAGGLRARAHAGPRPARTWLPAATSAGVLPAYRAPTRVGQRVVPVVSEAAVIIPVSEIADCRLGSPSRTDAVDEPA